MGVKYNDLLTNSFMVWKKDNNNRSIILKEYYEKQGPQKTLKIA